MQQGTVGEVSDKIKVEMTDAERIRVEVDEYYTPPEGSEAQPCTVGNLTEEEAYALAMYMRGLDTETIITSDSVKEDVDDLSETTLTYENLVDFVGHLNAKEEAAKKGKLKVTVNRTTPENVAEYLKDTNHTVNGVHKEDEATKTALCDAITILNNKAEASQEAEVVATTDDVKDTVKFTNSELGEFVEYMQKVQEKEVSEKIKVEMTDAERIKVEVEEYYAQIINKETGEKKKVGDLTEEEAYALAMYFKGLESTKEVSSDDLKKDGKIPAEAKVPYTSLNAFVKYLNEEKKENIPVTIKMTDDERIYDEIEKYLTANPIAGLNADAA